MKRTVIKAHPCGFCMGVNRAVELVEKEAARGGSSLYTLGPIIHNRQVQESLEARGVGTLASGEIPPRGSRVVIRAHGAPPDVEETLGNRGINLLDGTCPKVKKSHDIIEKYSRKGYRIIILGDKNHGEVKGLAGRALHSLLVSGKEELEGMELPGPTLLICQTTVKEEEFDRVRDAVLSLNPKARIHNAICRATKNRQEAVKRLCGEVDAVVVVGGRNSANTLRLFQTARERVPAFHVETEKELAPDVFGYRVIGVTAGASTPDSLIDRVIERLERE